MSSSALAMLAGLGTLAPKTLTIVLTIHAHQMGNVKMESMSTHVLVLLVGLGSTVLKILTNVQRTPVTMEIVRTKSTGTYALVRQDGLGTTVLKTSMNVLTIRVLQMVRAMIK